jgi:molecular chaperone IbpA
MTELYKNTGGYPKGPHTDRYTEPWGTKTTVVPEITISNLFPQFNKWAIGFDPLLETLKQVSQATKTGGYPPYNIYKKEDTYVLELAVAGFTREDITITVKELQMVVEGRLGASEEVAIHKGIATRDFRQEFVLAEYVVIKGAELKDGLLRITLEQELPAELQPKVIKIK